jgi:hypothetical protein
VNRGSTVLAKEQYIKRHDRVGAQLHFNIYKETGVQLNKKHWFENVPKSVETIGGGKATILWNQEGETDRTIPSNKPDIVVSDNEKGTCMLIDVAIPGDRNVIRDNAGASDMGTINSSDRIAATSYCVGTGLSY